MTSCPACGEEMARLPSWSGNHRLSWERCTECGRMEMRVDESVPPIGALEYAEIGRASCRERV